MKRIVLLIAALGSGCGPSTDSGDSDGNDGTSSDGSGSVTSTASASDTGGSEETSSVDGTSGGTESVDLCDTDLAMGISGLAIEVECDVGPPEECLSPASGRMIAVFAEDPRVEVDDFFPTELDPAILPVAEMAADGDGRFEIELDPGSWVLCAVFSGRGYCRTDIIVDDAQRVRPATHYSGNGDSWEVGFCPED